MQDRQAFFSEKNFEELMHYQAPDPQKKWHAHIWHIVCVKENITL
jgi:hypothetical protein